jgi:hypothetical protein
MFMSFESILLWASENSGGGFCPKDVLLLLRRAMRAARVITCDESSSERETTMQASHRQVRLWRSAFICTMLLPLSGWAANLTVDCSGATPGAFTSLQAAINSLDVIGPHQITMASHDCVENVQIMNRQRLTIVAPTGAYIVSAAGVAGDAMTISGSTGITFTTVGFRGGSRGVAIDTSVVAIHGTTIESNSGNGIVAAQNTTLNLDGLIQNNGGYGASIGGSFIRTGGGTQFLNNRLAGVYMTRSRGLLQGNTIQGSGNGVYLDNGSALQVNAPTLIQNNTNAGVTVAVGSSVEFAGSASSTGAPAPNVISGNAGQGIDVISGTASFSGANEISANGSGLQLLHAGARADLNGTLIFGGGSVIAGNTGNGIEVTTGSTVFLVGSTVTKNTGDGVRLQGNGRLVVFPTNNNTLTGNAARPVECDRTSLFYGDSTGIGELECPIVRAPSP